MTAKILKNVAKCKCCGQMVESSHVHEMVECNCGGVAVDGGHEYLRRVVNSMNDLQELSEVDGDPGEVQVMIVSKNGLNFKTLQDLLV